MRISDWSSDVCSSDLLINPDVVRQQIESGLIFGMATALGATTGFTDNLADARGFGDLGLPRPADPPDLTVELTRSAAEPGGHRALGVPPARPPPPTPTLAAPAQAPSPPPPHPPHP